MCLKHQGPRSHLNCLCECSKEPVCTPAYINDLLLPSSEDSLCQGKKTLQALSHVYHEGSQEIRRQIKELRTRIPKHVSPQTRCPSPPLAPSACCVHADGLPDALPTGAQAVALLPAHLLQHLESQVLVSQLLLGEVEVLGFLRRQKSMASGLQQSSWSKAPPMLHLTRPAPPPPPLSLIPDTGMKSWAVSQFPTFPG